jgi:glycosyltransferase involved in cell wall biosynthesis
MTAFPPTLPERNIHPLVSVIIPTRNSARTIRACLESLRRQTYPNLEIVVVDNFSSDSTFEIASKYADIVIRAGPERSRQVKIGFSHARGDFIYKVDSDFVLESMVVEKAVRTALEENAIAVIIPNLSDPRASFWAKVRFFERLSYVGSDQMEAARFFSRDAYEKVGGHDESLIAFEEHDLHTRVAKCGKISRISGSSEWHIGEPTSLSEVVTKHWYYGKSVLKYVRRYPLTTSTQLLPVRRSFIDNRRLLFANPTIFAGLVVYQCVRYLSTVLALLTELL